MNYVMFTRSNKSILTIVYTLGMFEKGKEKKKKITAAFLQLSYEKKIRNFNVVKVILKSHLNSIKHCNNSNSSS
jgi:hypothetical protein